MVGPTPHLSPPINLSVAVENMKTGPAPQIKPPRGWRFWRKEYRLDRIAKTKVAFAIPTQIVLMDDRDDCPDNHVCAAGNADGDYGLNIQGVPVPVIGEPAAEVGIKWNGTLISDAIGLDSFLASDSESLGCASGAGLGSLSPDCTVSVSAAAAHSGVVRTEAKTRSDANVGFSIRRVLL